MKLKYLLIIALAIAACNSEKGQQTDAESSNNVFKPFVEKIDTKLDELIDSSTPVEIISQGYEWSEGPVWIDGVGLLFSDIPELCQFHL